MENENIEVSVLGKPECVWCELVKEKFEKSGVDYYYVDITDDLNANAKRVMEDLELRTVPQIFVGKNHVGDSSVADSVIRKVRGSVNE